MSGDLVRLAGMGLCPVKVLHTLKGKRDRGVHMLWAKVNDNGSFCSSKSLHATENLNV